MTSIEGEGSNSTGLCQNGISLEAIQNYDCKVCPFGKHPDQLKYRGSQFEWKTLEKSANRRHCQVCARIFKFFSAQNLNFDGLQYCIWELGGTKTGRLLCFGTGMNWSYSCEFFVKTKEPAQEGSTGPNLYPDLNLDFNEIPRLRVPSGDTSSEAAFDTLKHWISQCEKHHEQCKAATNNRLPDRVLEIMSSEPLRIRLVENCMRNEKYACLSHRWAEQTERKCLTKQNLDLYKTEVPEDKLYPLVRDAIEATSRLGLRFIWIDCYCIIQNDIKDWEAEAAKMASIYENAFFTISATFAERGHSMFSTMAREFEAFQVTEISGEPVYIRRRLLHPCQTDDTFSESLLGPLLQRAWVFQERLLSRRFIHFTPSEMFWECRESTWCECESPKAGWESRRMRNSRTIGSLDWDLIVRQYDDTQLSREEDRLPALAGVARRYGELRGGWTYLAGLWKEQLGTDLAWFKQDAGNEMMLREQVAPTWSWASLPRASGGGAPIYTSDFRRSLPLVGYKISPPDADVYISGKGIEITVEGSILDLKVYRQFNGALEGRHEEGMLEIETDFKTDPDDDVKYRAVPNGSECKLLLLFEDNPEPCFEYIFGILLLRASSSACEGDEKFERIGYIERTGLHYALLVVGESGTNAEYRGDC